MQNSPAQSVGRCWRHPARQDLLISYNARDLFRSVLRRVLLTASGSSVSSLHVRLSCTVHRQVQTPGLACTVRRAMPCCHVVSLCSSVLFPPALFLSPWLCLLFSLVLLAAPFLYLQSRSRLALPLMPGVHQSLCWFRRLKLLHRWYPPHTRLGTQVLLRYIYNNYI